MDNIRYGPGVVAVNQGEIFLLQVAGAVRVGVRSLGERHQQPVIAALALDAVRS